MKKLSTISLFIFGVVLVSILTAGLVFYQNSKVNSVSTPKSNVKVIKNTTSKADSITTVKPSTTTSTQTSNTKTVLTLNELSKHNSQSDCWLLISGKVYDITSFFGSHPGGNGTMAATCGTDATDAYMTKDPYASSSSSRSAHSSRAKSMLASYYLGDLGQSI